MEKTLDPKTLEKLRKSIIVDPKVMDRHEDFFVQLLKDKSVKKRRAAWESEVRPYLKELHKEAKTMGYPGSYGVYTMMSWTVTEFKAWKRKLGKEIKDLTA